MDSHEIIKRPVLSEKSSGLTEKQNKYSFKVDRRANKLQIKRAVEELFKVKVSGVNTLYARGKKRRVRHRLGKTPDWKKAVVTLREGSKIEFV